jgi:hypothetical protein
MHPYKTITQTLLVLSILNPVLAAPTPRAGQLPAEESAPLQDPAPSSGSPPSSTTDGQVHEITEASTFAHPSSEAGGSAPEITEEASTSAHPLSAAGGSAPEITEEASTSVHRWLSWLAAGGAESEESSPAHPLTPITEEPSPTHTLASTVTKEGSTAEPHAAVTHDTLDTEPKQLKFFEKPLNQKLGVAALSLTAIAASVTGLVELLKHSPESTRREYKETSSDWSMYQK